MRPSGYLTDSRSYVDHIVQETARGFEVTVEEIVGTQRHRHIVVARACAMALVRQSTDWSWPRIAAYFNRDQTSVRHLVRKVMDDPELGQAVAVIADEMGSRPRLSVVGDT